MCNASCILFGARVLKPDDARGRRVLEVGSQDVNGSLRSLIESWNPAEYVGVDLAPGPGVDVVCPVEKLAEQFGEESFDLVVSTEMLEHVRDWRAAVSNLKRVTKPGGTLLITTRSPGFPYHAYPYDFWRYSVEDMKGIFSDMEIECVEPERGNKGVYLKAVRQKAFKEADLVGIELHSMFWNRRTAEIPTGAWSFYQLRCGGKALIEGLAKGCLGASLRVYGFLFRV